MEVGDGFAAVGAVVDCDPVAAFRDAEVGGNLACSEKEMAKDGLVSGGALADPRNGLFRHDKNVHGCLRRNIAEGTAEIVSVKDVRRDFPIVDFLEKCFHVGGDSRSRDCASQTRKSMSTFWRWEPLPSRLSSVLQTRVDLIYPKGVPISTNRRAASGSWKKTLMRGVLICAGSIAILLPAWLPNKPGAPLERGSVELMQAGLLAASTAVMLGALAHAEARRPVCRVIAFALAAALMGELEDFISGILKWPFPEVWVIGILLFVGMVTALRHRRVMMKFFQTIGHHAGAGFIGAALLILYVFNRVVGAPQFWQASLGDAFSPDIPRICKSYLELLACYFVFVGTLGVAITLGRREEMD